MGNEVFFILLGTFFLMFGSFLFGYELGADEKDRREAYRQKPAWGAGPEDIEHE